MCGLGIDESVAVENADKRKGTKYFVPWLCTLMAPCRKKTRLTTLGQKELLRGGARAVHFISVRILCGINISKQICKYRCKSTAKELLAFECTAPLVMFLGGCIYRESILKEGNDG